MNNKIKQWTHPLRAYSIRLSGKPAYIRSLHRHQIKYNNGLVSVFVSLVNYVMSKTVEVIRHEVNLLLLKPTPFISRLPEPILTSNYRKIEKIITPHFSQNFIFYLYVDLFCAGPYYATGLKINCAQTFNEISIFSYTEAKHA